MSRHAVPPPVVAPSDDDAPPPRRVAWDERAAEVGAVQVDAGAGATLVAAAWRRERQPLALDEAELARLAAWPLVVEVAAGRTLIRQDEHGDYLLLVLEGSLAVERTQPGGGRVRLAEARAGDMLGEMSLLDAGPRFSNVTTLVPCRLAVLQAEPFQRLMRDEPRLALALTATLSRRLSLRVRQLAARLGALLSPT